MSRCCGASFRHNLLKRFPNPQNIQQTQNCNKKAIVALFINKFNALQVSTYILSHQTAVFGNTKNSCFWYLQSIDNQRLNFYQTLSDSTGKEKDSESGFYYFGARYYDCDLSGLFLSVDPMSDKYPSISPYSYCSWNPIRIIDPDGKSGVGVIDRDNKEVTISMKLIFYGDCATFENAGKIISDLNKLYNDESISHTIVLDNEEYTVSFSFMANVIDESQAEQLAKENKNCEMNFVRITNQYESKFEIGGNNGCININDIANGTTPAHEIGHGFGLEHDNPYYVGKGTPHIMLAKGSFVDQVYQYNKKILPGYKGSAMNPAYRKVTNKNIEDIMRNINMTNNNEFTIGNTTNNIYE